MCFDQISGSLEHPFDVRGGIPARLVDRVVDDSEIFHHVNVSRIRHHVKLSTEVSLSEVSDSGTLPALSTLHGTGVWGSDQWVDLLEHLARADLSELVDQLDS